MNNVRNFLEKGKCMTEISQKCYAYTDVSSYIKALTISRWTISILSFKVDAMKISGREIKLGLSKKKLSHVESTSPTAKGIFDFILLTKLFSLIK